MTFNTKPIPYSSTFLQRGQISLPYSKQNQSITRVNVLVCCKNIPVTPSNYWRRTTIQQMASFISNGRRRTPPSPKPPQDNTRGCKHRHRLLYPPVAPWTPFHNPPHTSSYYSFAQTSSGCCSVSCCNYAEVSDRLPQPLVASNSPHLSTFNVSKSYQLKGTRKVQKRCQLSFRLAVLIVLVFF